MTRSRFPATRLVLGLVGALLTTGALAAKPTVAIFDFEAGSSETVEMRSSGSDGYASQSISRSTQTSLLTNKLITRMTETGEVSVVERRKIAKLVEESKLSQSALADPSRATEIGHMLGADYMVFGSITNLEPSVAIEDMAYGAGKRKVMSMTATATMRLVNTETGKIEAAADVQASRSDKQINPSDTSRRVPASFRRQVLDDLVAKLSNKIINTMKPIKVATQSGDTVYLSRASMEPGTRLEIIKFGEPVRDPDTGEILGQTEETLSIVEVTDGLSGMSKAAVVEWQTEAKKIPAGAIARPME